MTANASKLGALALHAASAAGFFACAASMGLELRGLVGTRAALELAAAAASGAIALLSLFAAVTIARAWELVPLRTRSTSGAYLQVLVAAGLFVASAQRIHVTGRPALTAFCVAVALWLVLLGFGAVPRYWIGRVGIVDHLGRVVRFSALEWFEVRTVSGDPPRFELAAGRGDVLRLRARLAEREPSSLRAALKRAGLVERQGRRG